MNIQLPNKVLKRINQDKKIKVVTLGVIISLVILTGIFICLSIFNKSEDIKPAEVALEVNGEKMYISDFIPYVRAVKNDPSIFGSIPISPNAKKVNITRERILSESINYAASIMVQVQKAKEAKLSLTVDEQKDYEGYQGQQLDESTKRYLQNIKLADKFKEKTIDETAKNVTEDEIESNYEEFKSGFVALTKYNVQQIIILSVDKDNKPLTGDEKEKVRVVVQNIYDRAKNGESFDELAKRYSNDAATKNSGGYTGLVEGSQIPWNVRGLLNDAKIGEVNLFDGSREFVIYKLIEKTPEHNETLDEAKEDIRYAISQDNENPNSYENLLNTWIIRSNIVKHFDVVGSIDISK